jgi:hypothetical protein
MEVGPRPVADPEGTILWFEYLLDSSLLEKQLLRENSGNFSHLLKN